MIEELLVFSVTLNFILAISWLFAVKREQISDSAVRILHDMLKEKNNG